MACGSLHAQVTVPTGGWAVALTITAIGGPYTVTIPAGTYYPIELLSAFITQLDAASGSDGAFSYVASTAENGDGTLQLLHATQTFSLTWTSTDLRDYLGFTLNLTPAASNFIGTASIQGIWLPDCPMSAEYGPSDSGHTESDRSEMVSPRGDVSALKYQSRTVLPSIRWSHVTKPRARISGELVVGASFERWWRNTHNGELSYFPVAPKVRVIWDANTLGTYTEYRLVGRSSTEMTRAVPEWSYLWPIEIKGIKVP